MEKKKLFLNWNYHHKIFITMYSILYTRFSPICYTIVDKYYKICPKLSWNRPKNCLWNCSWICSQNCREILWWLRNVIEIKSWLCSCNTRQYNKNYWLMRPLFKCWGHVFLRSLCTIHTSHQSLEEMHWFEAISEMFGPAVFEFVEVEWRLRLNFEISTLKFFR